MPKYLTKCSLNVFFFMMETILLPYIHHRLLCIYPLNYWAKKMVPVMVAWPERCQAAVPSQPFSELFVISHARSDSQRQMVFKQNSCGRKSGSWLNQPWQRLGTAKAGLRHPDSLPLDGRSKQEPVVPPLSAILFRRDSPPEAKNNCFQRSEVTCCRTMSDSNLTRSFVWSSQRCVTQTWISYSFETVFKLRLLTDSPGRSEISPFSGLCIAFNFGLPSALGTVHRRQPGNWESSRTESPMTHPVAHPIRC